MKSGMSGLIIAAAFIGPGTVTTASLAGAQMGYGLIWALVFAVLATCTMQEMSSRLGLVTGAGLSEAIVGVVRPPILRWLSIVLVVCAIGIGNAAYEGGNITGAALGLANALPGTIVQWAVTLGCVAFVLILINQYRLIEALLIILVAIMSTVFIAIMIIAGIDSDALSQGLSGQHLFSNHALLLAIIGTTLVPYNLFLHAGLSAKQALTNAASAIDKHALIQHRQQLFASIGIGGIVTFAIMSTAANAFYLTDSVLTPGNIAAQLQPVLGEHANLFFAIGLFSAGLTSAITAPLAAAYAICGLFAWPATLQHKGFKLISLTIISIGTMVAASGFKPLSIIVIAQVSNALLLPISVVFLLYVMNQKDLMKAHVNGWTSNILATLVLAVVFVLAAYKLFW